MTKQSQHVDKLSKFLSYVLGYRPDAFGIVLDEEGFVALKELLQALHEEPGWRHIREAHINAVAATRAKPVIEICKSAIRATERSQLPTASPPQELPKLLYAAIRKRAYPVVMERGLAPTHHRRLVLSDDMAMAVRIGRRADNNPVLLTIQVAATMEKETILHQYGQHLFLADKIAAGTFNGPPLSREKPDSAPKPAATKTSQPKTPGSFFPDPEKFQTPKLRLPAGDRNKEPDWKKARRRARRYKEHQNK